MELFTFSPDLPKVVGAFRMISGGLTEGCGSLRKTPMENTRSLSQAPDSALLIEQNKASLVDELMKEIAAEEALLRANQTLTIEEFNALTDIAERCEWVKEIGGGKPGHYYQGRVQGGEEGLCWSADIPDKLLHYKRATERERTKARLKAGLHPFPDSAKH